MIRATPSTVKAFRRGTHRTLDPQATVERIQGLAPIFGITRVANVTGLDVIGLPVVMVCRPNSRSLAVSQGKGLDLAAARASGLMEAIELWHAERIDRPLRLATHNQLRFSHRIANLAGLPRCSAGRFHDELKTLWIEGVALATGDPVLLPYELVHMDTTRPMPPGSGCFAFSSNGLASGNHPLEAIGHGLCEVIERDANTLFELRGETAEAAARVNLDTIDDPLCREVLDLYARAGVAVAVWDITSDLGVPAFRALVLDAEADPFQVRGAGGGMGCHPSRGVALLRALTEAAQSRLTTIAGARDDMPLRKYETWRDADALERLRQSVVSATPSRDYRAAPDFAAETFEEDLSALLSRLAAAGFPEVIAVDLTYQGIDLPVVRIVVPGLETSRDIPGWVPGARARAVATETAAKAAEPR
ncbi:MAG TPA: YcaO-like family protein [Thermoanaerobaculia bacterium]|nr:YcaO-like family protein [Thermoanaerobaculia bacterium]